MAGRSPAQDNQPPDRPAQPAPASPAKKNIQNLVPPGAKGPSNADKAGLAAARVLLKFESELRQTKTLSEFGFFVANETRQVNRSQQSFVFTKNGRGPAKITAVSAMTVVDRSAPLISWAEALVARLGEEQGLTTVHEFDADSFGIAEERQLSGYPLRFMAWVPMLAPSGKVVGGLLQAKSTPWTESDLVVSKHVASASAYSLIALAGTSPLSKLWRLPSRKAVLATAVVLAALGFFPVSMSALAPVEVSPSNSFKVTAPIDGVVDQVLVLPNVKVKKNQPLVRLADTVLRNRLEVAEREVRVAEAKAKKAAQLAFVDMRGRRELGIAQAELELRRSERDFARDLLERSTIRAPRDGIAFYSAPNDLVGRPAQVGEKLMELADPRQIEFQIDLPVADAIVLNVGARVQVFLDSDPLRPVEARLVRTAFKARTHDNQQLAFRLVAHRDPSETRPIRLGVRGTAQVFSEKVPLAFYLFRRPISAMRQWLGI